MTVAATAQITAPQAGYLLSTDGTVKKLQGTAGNLILGSTLEILNTNVISNDKSSNGIAASASTNTVTGLSFDQAGGIVTTATEVILFGPGGIERARYTTPAIGEALLSLQSRAAYFPSDNSLWDYSQGARRVPLAGLDGEVVAVGSIAPDGSNALLGVRRDDGIWRVEIGSDGSMSSQIFLAGVSAPLLLSNNGALYADGNDVVWREDAASAQSEKRWALDQPATRIRSIGNGWFQLGDYGIRLDREAVFTLPQAAPATDDPPVTPPVASRGVFQ